MKMKKEQKVISLELAKEIGELYKAKNIKAPESQYGYVDTRKSWKTHNCKDGKNFVPFHDLSEGDPECELVELDRNLPNIGYNLSKPLPAYDCAELGEMLLELTYSWSEDNEWRCELYNVRFVPRTSSEKSEAEARGLMLKYLLENNLIK